MKLPDMVSESAKLARDRTIVVGLPISDEVATTVIAKMLFLQNHDKHSPILLVINSPGGSITATVAILNTIDDLRLPVRTHCLRFCGGTAATLLAHGTRGMRSASPDSEIGFSRSYVGDLKGRPAEQIEANLKKTTELLVSFMARDSGQTRDRLESDMAREAVFFPEDARAYGLIDRIEALNVITL
jgi:ATP-dependent Clp protease protease subunit